MLQKLYPVLQEEDVAYIDHAVIHRDPAGRIKSKFAKKNVKVKYLPAHTTHLLSPLDKTPFTTL